MNSTSLKIWPISVVKIINFWNILSACSFLFVFHLKRIWWEICILSIYTCVGESVILYMRHQHYNFIYFFFYSLLFPVLEVSIAQFNGTSYLRYSNADHKPFQTEQEYIRFRFRTGRPNGILMHAFGSSGDYLLFQLLDSKLVVTLNLGKGFETSSEKFFWTPLGHLQMKNCDW